MFQSFVLYPEFKDGVCRIRQDDLEMSDDIAELINGIRDTWNEADDPRTESYVILDLETSRFVATLIHDTDEPEVCITAYADGRLERHRCVYVMGDDDMYDHTEVLLEASFC